MDIHDNHRHGEVDNSKLRDELSQMMIDIRAREKREEDRIASMRNEQAKEMERLIRDVQEQAAQREKALKEELEAAGREQRERFTEMLIEQEERLDKDREEQNRRALEDKTKRNKDLPAVPGDWEMEMREKVEIELKERLAALSKAEQELATREQKLRVAEKVRS